MGDKSPKNKEKQKKSQTKKKDQKKGKQAPVTSVIPPA
jgi:hypothetical protein